MNKIDRNARNLGHLVTDLLVLSRVEAGGIQVDPDPFSLFSVLSEAAAACADKAREKGLEFQVVPGPRERVYILGRPIREILPYVPIADRLRIGVSLLTYDGTAAFGVTTDFTAVPDARQFADALAGEVRALVPPGATRAKRTAASRKEKPDVQPRRHPARVGRGPTR